MRKYALAEERAAKTQKTTVRHFGFTEKVYGLPCTVRSGGSAIIGMPSCVFRFFTGRHSSGARRRRAASARIYIYMHACIHEAIQKPISENNIGAPLAPQKRKMRKFSIHESLVPLKLRSIHYSITPTTFYLG